MIAEVSSYRRDFPKPSNLAAPRCSDAVAVRYRLAMRTTLICIAALIRTVSLMPVSADEAEYTKTRESMNKPDGVNDETVRTITALKDPNKVVHRHDSRRSPMETCERMDVEIILTRTY